MEKKVTFNITLPNGMVGQGSFSYNDDWPSRHHEFTITWPDAEDTISECLVRKYRNDPECHHFLLEPDIEEGNCGLLVIVTDDGVARCSLLMVSSKCFDSSVVNPHEWQMADEWAWLKPV